MLLASFPKVTLWFFICLLVIKKGSLQFSGARVAFGQTDNQIREIAKEIRSYHFDVAEDQISNLKNTSKIQQIIHAAYQYGNDADDAIIDILEFASLLTQIDITFHVLKALRIEMAADGQWDPLKLIALAKAFVEYVQLQRNIADKNIEAEATKIINELTIEVKNPAIQILTAAMLSNNYFENSRAGKIADKIFDFPSLSEQVMQAMVNRTFLVIPASEIVEAAMRGTKYIPQRITVLLAVFRKLEESKDLDNDVVLKIADYIKEMRFHRNYENLYPDLKYEVNLLVDRLPSCARNLVFANEVCIWNRGRREYLYADKKRDKMPRDVYTCEEDDLLMAEGSWLVRKLDDDFLFKSQAFKKEFLGVMFRKFDSVSRYAQTEEKVRGRRPDSNLWKIELVGEYCFLKNQHFNEYLFASSKVKNIGERLVLSARASGARDIDEMDFQWQIRDCSL